MIPLLPYDFDHEEPTDCHPAGPHACGKRDCVHCGPMFHGTDEEPDDDVAFVMEGVD